MKNSGIEWVGEIPAHWEVMSNKHLMQKQKIICPIYKGQAILSLTMKGVIERDLDAGGKMPSSFDGYQYVKRGNLLLCLFDIDVTPRCAGLILKDGVTSPAYSQYIMRQKAYAPFYSYYYVIVDNTKELLHMAKNLRHSLNEEQFGAIKAPVPPISEQKAIAEFLDKKCGEVDALIADIQQEIETLEQYKRSVITEAVTKGLDPSVPMKDSGIDWVGIMPKHWKKMPNKYLMYKEKTICPVYNGESILSLTMKGVVVRDLEAGGKMPTSFDGYQQIKAGNLLMCLFDIDVTPRCIGLICNNGVTSPAYSQFIMKKNAYAPFYSYYYLMVDFTKELLHMAKNLRHSLNEEQFGAILAPVPPIEEQQQIADYLDKKCKEIEGVIADKQSQIETLESYKKSLIYEYVTGKKEVG